MNRDIQHWRCYSELCQLKTIQERYEYLKLPGLVGIATFGFDRYLNQVFYKSGPWKDVRKDVILRDCGCDLGILGYEIEYGLVVHHMNPITERDILEQHEWVLDPEYLICVSATTHKAIHYGDETLLPQDPIIRTVGDTCLW